MIIKNKNTKYGVIDPKGKVKSSWLNITDLIILANKNEVKMTPKDTIPKLVAQLEDLGYVIVSYGNISSKVRVPTESLYEDWKSIQMNDE